MIVALHPPLFFPWLGLLDRMARADLFIILDHLPFERSTPQHRARYLRDGVPRWLSVPLVHRSPQERIADKEVDHGAAWGTVAYATLRDAYRNATFFEPYAAPLRALLEARWIRLVDLAIASMELLREAFAIRTPMLRSSELGVRARKADVALEVCRAAGATTYLAGAGRARAAIDHAAFDAAGIRVERQHFVHPFYAQCGGRVFVPGLSGIDALLNCGPLAGRLLRAEPLPAAA